MFLFYLPSVNLGIRELEANVKANEMELRLLKRQLSLTDTSPAKAQVQAVAMKGKSILNPRVKRSRQSKGISFEDDSEDF